MHIKRGSFGIARSVGERGGVGVAVWGAYQFTDYMAHDGPSSKNTEKLVVK